MAKPVAGKALAAKPAAKPAARKPVAAQRGGSTDRGSVVVIGASVSSGKEVSASQAYPSRVAALSGHPVRVSSRVGAGYADGSIARLTRAANLPAQNPSLVVLQAGTNDVGAPPALVAGQVRQVVSTVRQQAPGAKIAVVTVFPSIHRGAAARTTDAAIIGAARSVDPSVVVISPLSEGGPTAPPRTATPVPPRTSGSPSASPAWSESAHEFDVCGARGALTHVRGTRTRHREKSRRSAPGAAVRTVFV